MAKFKVEWPKTYVATGAVEVEADCAEAARLKTLNNIGDYEGSTQYIADLDTASATQVEE